LTTKFTKDTKKDTDRECGFFAPRRLKEGCRPAFRRRLRGGGGVGYRTGKHAGKVRLSARYPTPDAVGHMVADP